MAFTLAEVLITLGIIGVVSALTLPTLINNYKKQVWVTQLKKSITVTANNLKYILSQYEVESLCDTPIAECPANKGVFIIGDKYGESLNLSEAPSNSLFSKALSDICSNEHLCKAFMLPDGSCIATASDYGGSWVAALGFLVDVNCDKLPNKYGRDRFVFAYDKDGNLFREADLYYNGSDDVEAILNFCENYKDYEDLASSTEAGVAALLGACTLKIVRDGWKMNY